MVAALLKIRVLQLYRELKAAGPLYGLILIGGFVTLLFLFLNSIAQFNGMLVWSGVLITIVIMIHRNRGDHRFLKLYAQRPWLVYFSEYSVGLSFFVVASIFKTGSWLPVLTYFFVMPVCFYSPRIVISSRSAVGIGLTGRSNYEWKSGIRKSGLALVLLWILAMTLSAVPYASLILSWFILLVVSSFYEQHEYREMLESFERNSRKFIFHKVTQQTVFFLKIILPVALASIIFFPDRWLIWLFFVLFAMINIAVFVVSKYAVWESGSTHRSVSLINAFCMVSFFVPFLLPLPLFVLVRNYYIAANRLKPVLDDFH
jgi:hypothetical protein